MTFQQKLLLAIDGTDLDGPALSRMFACSIPTASRWLRGLSEPHPALHASIFKAIREYRER